MGGEDEGGVFVPENCDIKDKTRMGTTRVSQGNGDGEDIMSLGNTREEN